MRFFINDFFSKRDQICSFLRIWSHLLEKSFMGNYVFYAVCPRDGKAQNVLFELVLLVFLNKKDLFSFKFKSQKCSGGEKRTEIEKNIAL